MQLTALCATADAERYTASTVFFREPILIAKNRVSGPAPEATQCVVIMIHVNEREALMKIDPETFYITNH